MPFTESFCAELSEDSQARKTLHVGPAPRLLWYQRSVRRLVWRVTENDAALKCSRDRSDAATYNVAGAT